MLLFGLGLLVCVDLPWLWRCYVVFIPALCVWCFWVVSGEFDVGFLGFVLVGLCFSVWVAMGVFVLFVFGGAACVWLIVLV